MKSLIQSSNPNIGGSFEENPDGDLIAEIKIWDETKTITLKKNNNADYLNFYHSTEQVYVQRPTADGTYTQSWDFIPYNYVNKVRRASITVQKVGADYFILNSYNVQNAEAYIVSWMNGERGDGFKYLESFHGSPYPISIQE